MPEETLEGKEEQERYYRERFVTIKSYHTNNGILKTKKWVEACHAGSQGLTFAGVNAHHQNGMAERSIRELQEPTHTIMIHASWRWPKYVMENLWPYAFCMGNNLISETPSFHNPDKKIPQAVFSGYQV